MSYWIILLIAGCFEVAWVLCIRLSAGWSKLLPALGTLVFLGCSMILLGVATKHIPIGTAYAVWTGIGIIGAFCFGIWLYQEPFTLIRMLCVLMIFGGIVGLYLFR